MKWVFYYYLFFNLAVVIGLLFYFPVVWLNLTFTFDYLTSSDIPFYNNASGSYDRYNAMWWIIAMDSFRWLIPLMANLTISLILLDNYSANTATMFYTIVFVILIIIEAVKVVIWTIQYVYCQDYQLCRNFDPAGNPDSANYVFWIMWMYSIIYFVIGIIYAASSSLIKKEAWKAYKDETETSTAKNYVVKINPPDDDTGEETYEDYVPPKSKKQISDKVGSKKSKHKNSVKVV